MNDGAARCIYGYRKIEPRPCFSIFVVLSKITLGLSSVFSQVKSNVDFVDKRLLTVNQQNKTAVTMPRHIRDFYVTSARKFKLNNDFSCSDNKKNGRNLPTESMFCAITSLLVKFRKSLHMAFEDDTSVENTRPFLRLYHS